MPSFVDNIYRDSKVVLEFLESQNKTPMFVHTSDSLRKSLLLSSASFFEDEIKNLLSQFSISKSSDQRLPAFIKNTVIERGYDKTINFDSGKINSFMGLFGREFLDKFNNDCKNIKDLRESSDIFIQIGSTRNNMIHGNLGSFFFDKTLDEVYEAHKRAEKFLEYLKKELR